MTNGDHAAEALARSGLPGDVLAWRDVLHDGPVPPDDDCVSFRRVRAQFLAARHWTTESDVVKDLTTRDARLDAAGARDRVVLWFEPDLYDQLQLIQALAQLSRRHDDERPQLSIVPADVFLGPLAPERFSPLYEDRRPIRAGDLALARTAWRAFTSSTPDALVALIARLDGEIDARTYAADAAVRLPHLAGALHRMLEEYPDADTGLTRSERQICEALADGAMPLSTLFRAAHGASESWAWLGDSSFAWYVQRLSDLPTPLVTDGNGLRVRAPTSGAHSTRFWEQDVQLTSFGLDVVHARADTVSVNGIDRWIGGAHLTAQRHWRWDRRLQCTVKLPNSNQTSGG